LETEATGGCRPALLDETIMTAIEAAATKLDLSHTRLMSFAGHDTQAMSAFIPSAMLFVPSVDGISHSPHEFTRQSDVVNGANVLLHTLLQLAQAAD
jgi:N-carbamoyl-L-amino-acid hydrolase